MDGGEHLEKNINFQCLKKEKRGKYTLSAVLKINKTKSKGNQFSYISIRILPTFI